MTAETVVQHTPGPWQVIGQTDILALVDTPDCIVVASTQFFAGPPTEQQIADARLIAAAPALLAAARRLWDRYEPAAENLGKFDPDLESLGMAIAKAEGPQP